MARLLWTQKQDFGPKPRGGHAMAFDDLRGRVVLFGGDSLRGPQFGDTWEWDGENWTQVADNGPSSRADHALAFDSERGHVLLFGGRGGEETFRDTWAWDGESWTQLADTGPSPRGRHALAFDVNRKRVVLFGGRLPDATVVGDTWEWDGTDWTQVADSGPVARCGHVMAYDSVRGRIVVFGGQSVSQALADTWEWTGQLWLQVADFGAPPCSDAAMAFDGKGVAVFGGLDARAAPRPQVFGDTWEWDGKHWTARQDMGPGPRWYHAMAFDAKRQRMVLYGGLPVYALDVQQIADRALGDTWEHSEAGLNTSAAEVTLKDFTIVPNAWHFGSQGHGSITLTGPAPAGGVAVQITSMVRPWNDYLIIPAAPVMVPPGSTTASFDLRIDPGSGLTYKPGPDVIRASLGSANKDVSIDIL